MVLLVKRNAINARDSPLLAPSVMQPRWIQSEGRGAEGVGEAVEAAVVVDALTGVVVDEVIAVVVELAAVVVLDVVELARVMVLEVVELATVVVLDVVEEAATLFTTGTAVVVAAAVVAVVLASPPTYSHMLNLLAAPQYCMLSPLQGILHCSSGICLPPSAGKSPPNTSPAYSVPHHLTPAAWHRCSAISLVNFWFVKLNFDNVRWPPSPSFQHPRLTQPATLTESLLGVGVAAAVEVEVVEVDVVVLEVVTAVVVLGVAVVTATVVVLDVVATKVVELVVGAVTGRRWNMFKRFGPPQISVELPMHAMLLLISHNLDTRGTICTYQVAASAGLDWAWISLAQ